MADTEFTLPYPEITKIPDTEPDAVPSLWNGTYEEIDANFAAVREGIESGSAGFATVEEVKEGTVDNKVISPATLSTAMEQNVVGGVGYDDLADDGSIIVRDPEETEPDDGDDDDGSDTDPDDETP